MIALLAVRTAQRSGWLHEENVELSGKVPGFDGDVYLRECTEAGRILHLLSTS